MPLRAWLTRLIGRNPIEKSNPPAALGLQTDAAGANDLAQSPSTSSVQQAEALRLEGNRFLDLGNWRQAEALYRQALSHDPTSASLCVNLGYVLSERNEPEQAQGMLDRALVLDPQNVDAQFMMGQRAASRSDWTAAVAHFERIAAIQPGFEPVYSAWALALVAVNEDSRALTVVDAGLAIAPSSANFHFYRGNLHLKADEFLIAQECFERTVALRPAWAEAHAGMGAALAAQGRLEEAISAYRKATEAQADNAESWERLGIFEQAAGKLEEARKSLQRVTEIRPQSARAWCNLATASLQMQSLDQARQQCMKAIALDPKFAPAVAMLATIEVDEGHPLAALPHFEHALSLDPENLEVRSNQLFALSYSASQETYIKAARDYGLCVLAQARPMQHEALQGDVPTPLHVGFVSGDLRTHPVGHFLESVLRPLRSHGIALYGFPTTLRDDDLTCRLKAQFAGWHPLAGLNDEAAARRIHGTGVHLLLDLSGHTAHNRLPVFAWQPAPLQASWLGYFASTGVQAIDYVVVDEASVPMTATDQFTEIAWHLPDTRLCFAEPGNQAEFPVSELPALRSGHITLGCYQNLNKLNSRVLSAWKRIMTALPTSRLRLQSKQTHSRQTPLIKRMLAESGLDLTRVFIVPPMVRGDYLRSHQQVDFLLDTFPFTGGTTTCEALWMGVPTLTLSGDTMLARQGAGLLSAAGLPDWIADSETQYVERSVAWGTNFDALADLRARLRQQVVSSPLFDGPRFAAHLAAAFKAMWAAKTLKASRRD